MISQIEYHVIHREFDRALELVPLLEQAFSDQAELVSVIQLLQQNIIAHSDDTLPTLQYLKQVIVG